MQLTELIAKLNNLNADAEVACFFKSLRQDALIWEGLHQLTSNQESLDSFVHRNLPLHPGSLGVFAFDPDIVINDLQEGSLSNSLLEKAMLGYEEYLLTDSPALTLEQAGTVAAALMAKQQAAGSWSLVFKEIHTRTRNSNPETYVRFWRSILVIVLNLVDEREQFLLDLVAVHQPETAIDLVVHLVLCLPITDEEQAGLLTACLVGLNEQHQVRALKVLRQNGGGVLSGTVAVRLLETYRDIESGAKSTGDHWKDPISSTKTAFKYQAVADIAQIAGDDQYAMLMNDKALEILAALVKRGKVRKAGLFNTSVSDENVLAMFSEDEMSDPDIQKELVYSGTSIDAPADANVHPVNLIKKSKIMAKAGNLECAREEIRTALGGLSDAELEKVLVNGPEQINSWDPLENLNLLVDTRAFEEAGKVAGFMLRDNPSNIEVNLAAARAAVGRGDNSSAAIHWETLTALQADNRDYKRNLAKALVATGQLERAYEVYNKLTENGKTGDLDDLLSFGEIALEVKKPADALIALNHLLERKPDHGKALTLSAIAYRNTGENSFSVDRFKQAMLFSDGDPQPWIALADLQWSMGDRDTSIATLKAGVAANPGNFEIQASYAGKLMQEGLNSEAFTLLKELSSREAVVEVDLLLVDAMERLGMQEIEETLEILVDRYPDDARFLADYGKRLVWKGETTKGLSLLQKAGDEIFNNNELALAYLEAVCKPDYRCLVFENPSNKLERQKTFGLLQNVLAEKAEDVHARLLSAENALFTGDVESAYNLFNELIGENSGKKSLEPARLFSGLAVAASRYGKLEIAGAALDQALLLEPDWLALQNIKAEILHKTGDDAEAVKLVLSTLQSTPADPMNQIWAVNFLQNIGSLKAATELICSSVEKYPQHLGLVLLKIENDLLSGEPEPDQEVQDGLFDLVEKCEDADLLERSAVVFAQTGNQERTVFCLEKAADLGNLTARFDLAGLYRIRKEFNFAQRNLDLVPSNEALVRLLKHEMLFALGKYDEIEFQDLDEKIDQVEIGSSDLFVPSEWMELLKSSCPVLSLAFKVAMKTGDLTELAESVQRWLSNEPDNVEAGVYGAEIALAAGEPGACDPYLMNSTNDPSSSFSRQFELLCKERMLDQDILSADQIDEMELFEVINTEEPEKIARIRELAKSGRLQEAERSFEMAFSVFDGMKEKSLVLQLGVLRNLAKCAIELSRWGEAFQLVNAARSLAPKNHALISLYLKARTLQAEFQNRAQNLGIKAHDYPISTGNVESIAEVIDAIGAEVLQQESIQHWFIRLQLALNASQENVREMAQLTPSAEDAAALMAGLRVIGQENTAKQVGKKFVQHPGVLFELALCHREDDLPKAIEHVSGSLEIHPHQPLAFRLLSSLFEKSGKLIEAVSMLENALSYWPNESNWHLDAADLWKRLGNLEKPIEHLRLASIYSPSDMEIKRSIGIALLKANKSTDALPFLLNVVQKDPADGDSWTALSEVYQMTGDLDLAEESAQKAIEVNPSAVNARLQAGKVSWAKGDLDKALEQVRLAISLNPEDPDNYVFMARLYAENGNKGKALEFLEKASRSENETVRTVIEHASLLKALNGSIAARDLIASFSQKYPENPDLLMLLAEAEDSCGETGKAEAVAKKALDIQPTEKNIHMLLGKILEKNGNLDQAAHYYSHAVAIEPTFIEAYIKLSQLHIRQREYGKARKVLEQGIENSPADINLYLTCASLLKEVKDYYGAEKMLRKASAIEPRNVLIHRQLGAILALNMVHQSQEVSTQI